MAVSARTVALTLLAVVLSALCIVAGLWQGSRTRDIVDAERAAVSAPIPVLEAASVDGFPATSVGRPVTASGDYSNAEQLLVAPRELDGRAGEWVVTPFLVDGVTVAVIRGWVDSPTSPALAVPSGPMRLEGALQPFEEFYAEQARRPDGTLVAVSRPEIEAAWGTPVLSLVLVLARQEPAAVPAPEPVPLTVQTADVPFPLQNFFYAFQWWIFAAFGVFLYLRWLWIEAGRRPDVD